MYSRLVRIACGDQLNSTRINYDTLCSPLASVVVLTHFQAVETRLLKFESSFLALMTSKSATRKGTVEWSESDREIKVGVDRRRFKREMTVHKLFRQGFQLDRDLPRVYESKTTFSLTIRSSALASPSSSSSPSLSPSLPLFSSSISDSDSESASTLSFGLACSRTMLRHASAAGVYGTRRMSSAIRCNAESSSRRVWHQQGRMDVQKK